MADTDNILPEVAKYLKSFPPRKRYTKDVNHFPFKKQLHCFYCGIERLYYRMGIFQDPRKPEKNYKKWFVTYQCDLCKATLDFKYIPPEEELKFLPRRTPS